MKLFIKKYLTTLKFNISIEKKFPNFLTQGLLNSMPYFPGCWLFYTFIFSQFPKKMRQVTVGVASQGKLIFSSIFDLENPPEFTMIKRNRFDLGTALVIHSLLSPGDTFFDIGANFGFFSGIASGKVGEIGTVISVEPSSAYKNLEKRKKENMKLWNTVAGETSDKFFRIQKPFYRQTTGSQFLLSPTGTVKSTTLDDIYHSLPKSKITLIKIDTEGAELFVLRGADHLLRDMQPLVIAEVFGHSTHFGYESEAIYKYMESFGYHFFYSISDDEISIEESMRGANGQILFSTRKLEDEIFKI